MADKKYCPINSHPQSDGMCHKEKCALWNSQVNICGILLIGNEIALTKVGKL